jgi:dimethylargininase
MIWAVTRDISPSFDRCQLTHLPRVPIDIERARAQHGAYEWALVELGCTVRRIDSPPDLPDAVFIEDTAVIFPEAAVIARPGAEARRTETDGVREALGRFGMPMHDVAEPATLDGGDVLVIERQVFIGSSTRTNATAVNQMRRFLRPLGYKVRVVPIEGCLHLKSAVTAVAPDTVLVNRECVPPDAFTDLDVIEVDPDEPGAANALLVGDAVIHAASFPKTRARLERKGLRVRVVDVDELAKAEGGVTCCSLVVRDPGAYSSTT